MRDGLSVIPKHAAKNSAHPTIVVPTDVSKRQCVPLVSYPDSSLSILRIAHVTSMHIPAVSDTMMCRRLGEVTGKQGFRRQANNYWMRLLPPAQATFVPLSIRCNFLQTSQTRDMAERSLRPTGNGHQTKGKRSRSAAVVSVLVGIDRRRFNARNLAYRF